MDSESSGSRVVFLRELRKLLPNLYKPGAVRHSPLLLWFHLENQRDASSALQQLLIKAVESLEPGPDCPLGSSAWRVYQVLHGRYIEQFSQDEVARDLFLSPRQLRRLEVTAVKTLADYLWDAHPLDEKEIAAFQEPAAGADGERKGPSGPEEELAWLERMHSSQVVDCLSLIDTALQTARPFIDNLGSEVILESDPGLPLVAVQATALKQALLHLITCAARFAGPGQVKISAGMPPDQPVVRLSISAQPAGGEDQEGLPLKDPDGFDMVRKLIQLSKGSFDVQWEAQPRPALALTITLPTAEQIPVLVIDDNVDTLKLIERYLSGTRYRFLGVSHPSQALEAAANIAPKAILLDVMLPDVDGWDVLGRLRAHPNTQEIPVIVCTILPQEPLALMLGAADFLNKPVRREQLLSILDRLTGLASPKPA